MMELLTCKCNHTAAVGERWGGTACRDYLLKEKQSLFFHSGAAALSYLLRPGSENNHFIKSWVVSDAPSRAQRSGPPPDGFIIPFVVFCFQIYLHRRVGGSRWNWCVRFPPRPTSDVGFHSLVSVFYTDTPPSFPEMFDVKKASSGFRNATNLCVLPA